MRRQQRIQGGGYGYMYRGLVVISEVLYLDWYVLILLLHVISCYFM